MGKDLQQEINKRKGPYHYSIYVSVFQVKVGKDFQQEINKRKGPYHYFLDRCQDEFKIHL